MTAAAPALQVCHSLPGRLRLKVPAIYRREAEAGSLAHWLSLQEFITATTANPVTGSLILYYRQEVRVSDLLALVAEGVRQLPQLLATTPSWSARLEEVRLEKNDRLAWGIRKLTALTGFLGLNLFSSLVWGAPFSPAVLTAGAVMASLPLWYRTLTEISGYRFLGLHPLLSMASILAIATGEAMTALEVIWILDIGEVLEEYVADRSRRAIRDILQVCAKNTIVLVDGVEVETPVQQVQVGDVVVVRPMEKIPVDGVVVFGEALVDQAHFTGCSEPGLRREGDPVYAGTIVQDGRIRIRAEKVGEATYLNQIIFLVERSLLFRPQAEKQAELLAVRLSRLGLAATFFALVLTQDLAKVFAVLLVMACPCATILAAATAVSASLANAADHLILIKGGLYLERFGATDCLCFDKTGTITTGVPEVRQVAWHDGLTDYVEVLTLAAVAEYRNPHPLAKAVVKKAEEEGLLLANDAVSDTILGRGVRTVWGMNTIVVGSHAFFLEEGITTAAFDDIAAEMAASGLSILYVAKNQRLLGLIGLAAAVRPELPQVMDWLRRDGVQEFHLVSGDAPALVERLARAHGFDGYGAALLPEEKAAYVAALMAKGRSVAFVGDGVNDAPALTKAEVGVAMGAGGSETAIATADIALVDDDLRRLIYLRQLSWQTLGIIQQNFWMALATDLLGVGLALTGRLTPVIGGLLHVGHAALISANSGRLLSWQPTIGPEPAAAGSAPKG